MKVAKPYLFVLIAMYFLANCSSDDSVTPDDDMMVPGDTISDSDDSMAVDSIALLGQIESPGAILSDVWGYVDANNKEFAVVGEYAEQGGGSVTLIDVSDPGNPTVVSSINGNTGFDVKVWKNYIYATDGGLSEDIDTVSRIIDIADPSNPKFVGTFPTTHNAFIDEKGFLYLEGGLGRKGLRIYDLNPDPANPTFVWKDTFNTNGHDMAVIRDRLYDFHSKDATYIYDVTNPRSPQLLGTVNSPGTFHHSGWVTEDDQYLFICDETAPIPEEDITIWDISDPANPVKVGGITDPGSRVHNLYVIDNFAYVSYYGAGFRVYDISDPVNPELADEFDTNAQGGEGAGNGFEGAFGAYPFTPSKNIYVSDMDNGLFVFSFSGRK